MRATWARYGRDAATALRAEIAAAKGDEPLAPVTVVVPSNQVGVSARRLLASGAVGSVCGSGTGLVAVSFLTAYRLAELLGAAALAGAGRQADLDAGLDRRSARVARGRARPLRAGGRAIRHRSRARRRVPGAAGSLPAALDALAGTGRRAADVVRLHRATRARLEPDWYDEEDLHHRCGRGAGRPGMRSDVQDASDPSSIYLPQRLSLHAATLLSGLAAKTDVSVVAAFTGDSRR